MHCQVKTVTGASRIFVRGAFVLSLLLLVLTGCSPEQEIKILKFLHPTVDQKYYLKEGEQKDSVVFLTSDAFEVNSEASWITVRTNKKNTKIVNDGYSVYRICSMLTITEDNPTDEERVGIVTVTTVNGTIAVGFYQHPKSGEE